MAFAEHAFAMQRRVGTGAGAATQRDHLRQAAKGLTKGAALAREMLAKDDALRCPVEHGPLYDAFLEMDRWRGAGGMGGPSPLTLHDVEAWQRLSGVTLHPQQVALVKRLDHVRLASLYAKDT